MLTLMNLCNYPYSITINECKGSCNTINDPLLNSVFLIPLKT